MAGSTYEFNSIAGSFLLLFSSSRLHMHLVGLENTTLCFYGDRNSSLV